MLVDKCIALVSAVVLALTLSSCIKASNEPVLNPDNHTVPLPPAVTLSGIKRTEGINALTGLPEKENEKGKRPIAIMIDNVASALPQRGISEADIIYEMVTESGITRLMAMFSNYEALPLVGPVRSARDQHVKLMLPFNALFLHIGTSTYALDLLDAFKYKPFSINGLYQPGALTLDSERAQDAPIEHCWFTDGASFTAAAAEYKLRLNNDCIYSAFKFITPPIHQSLTDAYGVNIRFSSYVTSNFEYKPESQKYYKSQFGRPHIDANTNAQLAFDNVIILFTDITKYPDNVLANVRYDFGGVGYYFSRGGVQQIRWAKPADNAPIMILTPDGMEQHIEISTGTSYLAMVDLSMYEHFNIVSASNMPLPDNLQSNIPK